MKIAIFGATGATGTELVKQALEKNCEVFCLVRNNLNVTHPQLHVVKGSLDDLRAVKSIIKDCQAVISLLGSAPKFFGDKSTNIYSKGASVIIEAMISENIKKLIFCTSAGVENDPNEIWLYRHILKPFLLQKSYDDMQIAETTISASSLDWVLVRPARLINGQISRNFRVSRRFRPDGGSKITRADLAFFILNQVNSKEWIHQTPTITY